MGAPDATMATVAAAEDFYQFANGWWLDDPSNTIPGEYSSWGSFIQLHDKSLKTQVSLCHELAQAAQSKEELLLARVWNASLNKFAQWEQGEGDLQPVFSELEQLEACLEGADWSAGFAKYLGRCSQISIGSPFDFDKIPNLKDSENVVLELGPSGLSLPSRDYYFEDNFSEQRDMFRAHLSRISTMMSFGENFAERVFRFERKLATIQMKPSQGRNYDQYFTVCTLDKFVSELNSLRHLEDKLLNYSEGSIETEDLDHTVLTQKDWKLEGDAATAAAEFVFALYGELGLRTVMNQNYMDNYTAKGVFPADPEDAEQRMLVFDGDYFRRVFALICGEGGLRNKEDIRAYMQYKIVCSCGQYCTKALDDENFEFYSKQLGGQKEQKSPEKRTVGRVNSWVGELLGQAYVARYFSEDDKDTVKGLIDDVLEIMRASLDTNDWLTDETKAKALLKLAKFRTKIGYPDKWKSFEGLEIEQEDDLFAISKKIKAFEYQTEFLEKLNTPKDKEKWEMHPQQVNAYYHPLYNEIVFPAAILQPPFYSKSLEDVQFDMGEAGTCADALTAINFGAIGAVIAHEITHGFDDQGRKFDADGNINDWWTEGDAALFKSKTDLMQQQAELYEYTDTENGQVHKQNGQLTMGENLADLGGMSLGVQAMLKRLGENNPHRQAQLQLLFLSWANVWKSKATNEDKTKKLATDPHAACEFRANLVKNVDQFYEAFDVPEGSSMSLPKKSRVQMW